MSGACTVLKETRMADPERRRILDLDPIKRAVCLRSREQTEVLQNANPRWRSAVLYLTASLGLGPVTPLSRSCIGLPPQPEVLMEASQPTDECACGTGLLEEQRALPQATDASPQEAVPYRTSARGMERFLAGRTLLSGDGPAWTDLFVQVFSRHSHQKPFLVPAVAEPLIVWVISGEAIVEERELGGEWSATRVHAGTFFLTSTDAPYEMQWSSTGADPFQVMHLYLSVPLFERVARELLGQDAPVQLIDVSGAEDEELTYFLAMIYRELTAESKGSALFLAGLAQSLAVHLIRNYSSSEAGREKNGMLPGYKLRKVLARMESHLDEPFNLGDLASEAGLSEFHFTRAFKSSTGISPSRHFIRQRIARAQTLLQETELSIIAVGNAVGYSSPSHFAQVFKRETGLSPSDYRRR